MSSSTPTALRYSLPDLGLQHHVLSFRWSSSVCCRARKPALLSPVPFTGPVAPSVPSPKPAGRCSVGLCHLPLHLCLSVGLALPISPPKHLSSSLHPDSPEGKWHVTKGPSHESPTFDSFFLPFLQWFQLRIQECSSCQCFLGRGRPAGTSWPRWLWKPGLRLPSSLHLDPKIATPEGSHFHSCQSEHRVG